jgi:CBS domain containing-hemolysin-like protein
MDNGLNYLYTFLLLLVSAFFSAAEIAFLTSDKIKLKEMASEGISWASGVLKLRLDREKTLTAILLLNNLVNNAATVLATVIAQKLSQSAVVWVTPIMTAIIVIFGEMIPKTAGSRKPISIAKFALFPMRLLIIGLTPIIWILQKITEFFLWIMHLQPDSSQSAVVTEDELEAMINISHQEGLIPTEERVMIEKVFEFGDTTVYDVMVPRVDIVSAPVTSTVQELLSIVKEYGHSRLPIYRDNPDNVIGILHVKDLITIVASGGKGEFKLDKVLRESYFIPDSKHISEVFREMRAKRIHLGMVVDEFGGISGLITLEDLLEELVGEIQDEYDTDEESVKKINESTYIIQANLNMEQVNEVLNTDLSNENYDTLAGFMMDRLGHLGKVGEKVETEDFTFIIDQIRKMRILKVKVIDKREKSKGPEIYTTN